MPLTLPIRIKWLDKASIYYFITQTAIIATSTVSICANVRTDRAPWLSSISYRDLGLALSADERFTDVSFERVHVAGHTKALCPLVDSANLALSFS